MRNVIFRLARPVLRVIGRDDQGVIGVLVVVLIGGGVLLGIGAIVIDLGRLYQNRAELQSGADAAALGVAKNCALNINTCQSNATSAAVRYADLNASQLTGHSAGVYGICVSAVSSPGNPGFTFGACPPSSTSAMTNCPSNQAGTNYVDVKTYTQVGSSHVLPPALAHSSSTVYACAQAEWGAALQSNSLALTISTCAWQALTGNRFGILIPVYLKGKLKTTCLSSNPSAGSNLPGGFDWLQTTSPTTCTTKIDLTTDTTLNNTGANVTQACKQALQNDIQSSATVFLPIFDCDSTVVGCPGYKSTGANAIYHISGLAGFVPTGYRDLPGGGGQNNYGNNSLCTVNDPCIEGYFKPGIDPVSDLIGNGTNYGAIAVKLSG
jgi:Flp pilus assembly protein TadG